VKSKKNRNIIVSTHRYLGLLVGLILIIVGLTGSLLVFKYELDDWAIQQQFGRVVAQEQVLSPAILIDNVKIAYANRPNWQISELRMLPDREIYTVRLNRPDETQWEVFIDPYTGKIISDRQQETALFSLILHLHYELLSGNTGTIVVGTAALFLCILTITGTILWSGWRKLWLGFKINWKAHPIRVNYDIHKVAGIITAVFLGATAFTGFCWNFYDYSVPAIYAATFTSKPVEVKSTIVTGKSTLELSEILTRSTTALPGAINTFISFPKKPEDVFEIYKKVPGDSDNFSSYVKLDRYSGKILQVQDSRTAKLGDRILNAFTPLHYGTFGGLPTRILYVFVGLAPLVLFITGAKMFGLRTWGQAKQKEIKQLAIAAHREHHP
jgi:uncharacterized iron-regulated membrane protein